MLYADDARRITIEVREGCTAKDLEVIEQAINEAIEKGEFRACLKGAIKPAVKEKLESWGYKVHYSNQYNETWTDISWSAL